MDDHRVVLSMDYDDDFGVNDDGTPLSNFKNASNTTNVVAEVDVKGDNRSDHSSRRCNYSQDPSFVTDVSNDIVDRHSRSCSSERKIGAGDNKPVNESSSGNATRRSSPPTRSRSSKSRWDGKPQKVPDDVHVDTVAYSSDLKYSPTPSRGDIDNNCDSARQFVRGRGNHQRYRNSAPPYDNVHRDYNRRPTEDRNRKAKEINTSRGYSRPKENNERRERRERSPRRQGVSPRRYISDRGGNEARGQATASGRLRSRSPRSFRNNNQFETTHPGKDDSIKSNERNGVDKVDNKFGRVSDANATPILRRRNRSARGSGRHFKDHDNYVGSDPIIDSAAKLPIQYHNISEVEKHLITTNETSGISDSRIAVKGESKEHREFREVSFRSDNPCDHLVDVDCSKAAISNERNVNFTVKEQSENRQPFQKSSRSPQHSTNEDKSIRSRHDSEPSFVGSSAKENVYNEVLMNIDTHHIRHAVDKFAESVASVDPIRRELQDCYGNIADVTSVKETTHVAVSNVHSESKKTRSGYNEGRNISESSEVIFVLNEGSEECVSMPPLQPKRETTMLSSDNLKGSSDSRKYVASAESDKTVDKPAHTEVDISLHRSRNDSHNRHASESNDNCDTSEDNETKRSRRKSPSPLLRLRPFADAIWGTKHVLPNIAQFDHGEALLAHLHTLDSTIAEGDHDSMGATVEWVFDGLVGVRAFKLVTSILEECKRVGIWSKFPFSGRIVNDLFKAASEFSVSPETSTERPNDIAAALLFCFESRPNVSSIDVEQSAVLFGEILVKAEDSLPIVCEVIERFLVYICEFSESRGVRLIQNKKTLSSLFSMSGEQTSLAISVFNSIHRLSSKANNRGDPLVQRAVLKSAYVAFTETFVCHRYDGETSGLFLDGPQCFTLYEASVKDRVCLTVNEMSVIAMTILNDAMDEADSGERSDAAWSQALTVVRDFSSTFTRHRTRSNRVPLAPCLRIFNRLILKSPMLSPLPDGDINITDFPTPVINTSLPQSLKDMSLVWDAVTGTLMLSPESIECHSTSFTLSDAIMLAHGASAYGASDVILMVSRSFMGHHVGLPAPSSDFIEQLMRCAWSCGAWSIVVNILQNLENINEPPTPRGLTMLVAAAALASNGLEDAVWIILQKLRSQGILHTMLPPSLDMFVAAMATRCNRCDIDGNTRSFYGNSLLAAIQLLINEGQEPSLNTLCASSKALATTGLVQGIADMLISLTKTPAHHRADALNAALLELYDTKPEQYGRSMLLLFIDVALSDSEVASLLSRAALCATYSGAVTHGTADEQFTVFKQMIVSGVVPSPAERRELLRYLYRHGNISDACDVMVSIIADENPAENDETSRALGKCLVACADANAHAEACRVIDALLSHGRALPSSARILSKLAGAAIALCRTSLAFRLYIFGNRDPLGPSEHAPRVMIGSAQLMELIVRCLDKHGLVCDYGMTIDVVAVVESAVRRHEALPGTPAVRIDEQTWAKLRHLGANNRDVMKRLDVIAAMVWGSGINQDSSQGMGGAYSFEAKDDTESEVKSSTDEHLAKKVARDKIAKKVCLGLTPLLKAGIIPSKEEFKHMTRKLTHQFIGMETRKVSLSNYTFSESSNDRLQQLISEYRSTLQGGTKRSGEVSKKRS